ncbi:hypothetical protein F6S08_06900 [Pseudomonas sp. JV449]|jgi:hypothetical protein|uniref:hypothetical protein n=1 Tax=Pseudomonas sp. JV449 TaxID=1890658 RepID=UPI0028E0C23F|nr:hypothetical protein [Pseudomonas sp. JV449]MDT9630961.1 hypothetical protein [Pseudomonas sp. JV449]
MSVDYKEFIEFASSVLNDGSSEFDLRNSISRSYYATYHAALAYADVVSVPPVSDCSGPTHRKLSSFFEGSMNADHQLRLSLRKLGYSLKQLHANRVMADYKLEEMITLKVARDHLSRCEVRLQEVCVLSSALAA